MTGGRTSHAIAEQQTRGILKAVIVDDEALSRRRLAALIEAEPDVEVVAECSTPGEAVAAIAAHDPEIIFLDIEMPRGSGFTVLRSLDAKRLPAVIFVTAHEQYAVEAFGCHAVDYLLKPFDRDRFRLSLDRARQRMILETLHRAFPDVLSHEPPRRYMDKITVRSSAGISFVRVADIDWVETAGNYVRLHVGRESHLVRETMGTFESQLDPRRFVRTHRSTIVNFDRVVQLIPSFGREYVVVLRDGTRLKLGAQYRDNVRRLGFSI